MVADGLLTRQRFREVPPRVEYGLTARARELMPVLGALARWGYEWAWSPPRSGEAIDLGAIFRLIPGLLSASDLTGSISLAIQENGQETSYTVAVADGEIALRERAEGRTEARIAGTRSAWISALSPENDRRGLEISGEAALAGRLIDALAGGPSAGQAAAAETGATAAA
jgi:hypothetical protein